MTLTQFRIMIGVGGVPQTETPRIKRIGNIIDSFMFLIAFWLPVQWYLQVKHFISPELSNFSDWFVWSAFVIEALVMGTLVKRKVFYFLTNWLNAFIIIVSFPLIWLYFPFLVTLRAVRILLIVRLTFPWMHIARDFLSKNHLGTTLIISVILTCLSGMLLSTFDSGIPNPFDGIWWAWETVTTVGYGDVVPVSPFGRILAILIMILGLGLFSLLTANFSAFLIGREQKEEEHREERILTLLHQIQMRLQTLERQLEDKKKEE